MIWKDVVGFEGSYKVSDTGLVYSFFAKRLKATKKNNRGYVQISLHKEGKEHMWLLHRVVAMAFIPNPSNHPQINHIDEDKDNNHVNNLEWCTNKHNRHHGTGYARSVEGHDYKRMGFNNGKPVTMFSLCGKEIASFPSVVAAQRETGISESNIRQSCYGKRRTAGGYSWKYCDSETAMKAKHRALSKDSQYRFEAVV